MTDAPPPPAEKAEKSLQAQLAAAGPLMNVVVRNEFYRDGFRTLMKIAVAQAVVIICLLLLFVSYMSTVQTKDHYFATTADGRIMQLVPLERANMGTADLLSWATQAATETMTFGFHDYQRRLQNSSRYFTRTGWEHFAEALQKSRTIESVEASSQVVSAEPRSAPTLLDEGALNGRYRWVVNLPLTVRYQGGSAGRTDQLNVILIIERVPSLESPSGVGIAQWVARGNG